MALISKVTIVVLVLVMGVSVLSTSALVLQSMGTPLSVGPGGIGGTSPIKPSGPQVLIQGFFDQAYIIAPASWALLCGMWIWRGKVRTRWNSSGFAQDSFDLLVKMKGGPTRVKLLNALDAPKDRSRLAQEIGMDWKAVDRHVQLLMRYSFIKEEQSIGSIKLYKLTPEGEKLLHLIQEMAQLDVDPTKVPSKI